MAIVNKVTRLYPVNGVSLTENDIQTHFDSCNADGWELIAVSNLDGWYRFYWRKDQP